MYFYNSVTKQSVWERPKEMDEEESDNKKTTETDDQPAGANTAKISKEPLSLSSSARFFYS